MDVEAAVLDQTPVNFVALAPLSFSSTPPDHVSAVYEGRAFT